MGCYWDGNPHVFSNNQYFGDSGTTGQKMCQDLARQSNSNFYALEFGNQCYYGWRNDLSNVWQTPDSYCSMRCGTFGVNVDGTFADVSCGGNWLMQVYQLKVSQLCSFFNIQVLRCLHVVTEKIHSIR